MTEFIVARHRGFRGYFFSPLVERFEETKIPPNVAPKKILAWRGDQFMKIIATISCRTSRSIIKLHVINQKLADKYSKKSKQFEFEFNSQKSGLNSKVGACGVSFIHSISLRS